MTKEQQNQAAVQAILSEQVRQVAPPVPGATPALSASDLLAQGVIVTPAAKDVINVHNIKKGAAANTDRAVYAAADRAFTEGQYATAVDLYDRILRRSPSNKVALYGKALSLHKAGRNEEALK
ncbi:MAG TPA: tetratricopeptide repeat protein, partial [Methylophilus sp.]